jgi:ABC-type glycerol-3-phosphate transport system permease component
VRPPTIYILTSFFRKIPKELEEAALVDGATHFQAFRRSWRGWTAGALKG